MSRAIMFVAPKGGTFQQLREFGNSWGGAARIWSAISKRYFGDESYWLIRVGRGEGDTFWGLAKREDVPLLDRIIHATTFDRAIVTRNDFGRLATLFREFDAKYPVSGVANHLPDWADLLDKLAGDEHGLDFTPFAVGWQHTTVSQNLWWISGDEDKGEPGRRYDLSKDEGHWNLFEQFEPERVESA